MPGKKKKYTSQLTELFSKLQFELIIEILGFLPIIDRVRFKRARKFTPNEECQWENYWRNKTISEFQKQETLETLLGYYLLLCTKSKCSEQIQIKDNARSSMNEVKMCADIVNDMYFAIRYRFSDFLYFDVFSDEKKRRYILELVVYGYKDILYRDGSRISSNHLSSVLSRMKIFEKLHFANDGLIFNQVTEVTEGKKLNLVCIKYGGITVSSCQQLLYNLFQLRNDHINNILNSRFILYLDRNIVPILEILIKNAHKIKNKTIGVLFYLWKYIRCISSVVFPIVDKRTVEMFEKLKKHHQSPIKKVILFISNLVRQEDLCALLGELNDLKLESLFIKFSNVQPNIYNEFPALLTLLLKNKATLKRIDLCNFGVGTVDFKRICIELSRMEKLETLVLWNSISSKKISAATKSGLDGYRTLYCCKIPPIKYFKILPFSSNNDLKEVVDRITKENGCINFEEVYIFFNQDLTKDALGLYLSVIGPAVRVLDAREWLKSVCYKNCKPALSIAEFFKDYKLKNKSKWRVRVTEELRKMHPEHFPQDVFIC